MRLQYAIDVLDRGRALDLAAMAVDAGVTSVEAGHVLVKACGVGIVTDMRVRVGDVELIADMKTMDMGADEVRVAADAGADLVIVCGAASTGVVRSALTEGDRQGVEILVSLMGVRDRLRRTRELAQAGVTRVLAHRGIDDDYLWSDPAHLADLQELLRLDGMRVGLAGGLDPGSIATFAPYDFERIVVGRGITAAPDPATAIRRLLATVERGSGQPILPGRTK